MHTYLPSYLVALLKQSFQIVAECCRYLQTFILYTYIYIFIFLYIHVPPTLKSVAKNVASYLVDPHNAGHQALPRVGWHGLSFNAFMVSPMALLEQMNTWQVSWKTNGVPN